MNLQTRFMVVALAVLPALAACSSDSDSGNGSDSGTSTDSGATGADSGTGTGGTSVEGQACGVALENRTCVSGLRCAQQSTNPKDLICMQSAQKGFGETCTSGGTDCGGTLVCSGSGVCVALCNFGATPSTCTDGYTCCDGAAGGVCKTSCN